MSVGYIRGKVVVRSSERSKTSVSSLNCTDVRFTSFLSSKFITAIVVNSLERKLAKQTSVNCWKCDVEQDLKNE